jgi:hypothetical protein
MRAASRSLYTNTLSNRDVLRRHWTTCAKRRESGQEIPKADAGGKHKHACDACARLKKACNGQQPCAECESRGKLCSYERLTRNQPTRVKRESTLVYAEQQDWETKGFGYQTLLPPKPTYQSYRPEVYWLPIAPIRTYDTLCSNASTLAKGNRHN